MSNGESQGRESCGEPKSGAHSSTGTIATALEPASLELAAAIGQLLRSQGATLSVAESCTGGLIGALVTAIPGSSDYFLGGVVSYANQVKEKILGVHTSTLEKHGAVSQPCVEEMASGVRRLIKTTYSVAVSGIAGPGGGTETKPVGTVHFAVDWPAGSDDTSADSGTAAGNILATGDREAIRRAAAHAALELLRQVLIERSKPTGPAGERGESPDGQS